MLLSSKYILSTKNTFNDFLHKGGSDKSNQFYIEVCVPGAREPYIEKCIAVLMWYVYILKCSDNTYYTGCTPDLEDRLHRHSKGENTCTKEKLPVVLIKLRQSHLKIAIKKMRMTFE